MKYRIIFMNDAPMYVSTARAAPTDVKLESLAKEYYDRHVGCFDGTEKYDDYRRRIYWHVHIVHGD